MEPRPKISVVRRELRGIGAALLLVAATAAVSVLLRACLHTHRDSVLYLVPVMLLGYYYGVVPALVAAVSGVVISGYMAYGQLYSFELGSPQQGLYFVLYTIVAVVVSHYPAKRSDTSRSHASANGK